MICHCNLREKVKVRLIQSKYIISKLTNESDSLVVIEVASEHEGSGFESILVLLFLFLISYVKCFYKDIF